MRVLIYEPNFKGHHFVQLALIVEAAATAGAEVTVALTKAGRASEEFRVALAPISSMAHFDAWIDDGPPAGPRAAMFRTGALQASVRRARAEHVFVPYGDNLTVGLTVRRVLGQRIAPRGVPVEVLYHASGLASAGKGRGHELMREMNFAAALRLPFDHNHHVDPRVLERIAGMGRPALAAKWSMMPDAVEAPEPRSKIQARAKLGLPEDGFLLGTAGVIDTRKGCDLLLRAFKAAKRPASTRLLLIGPHSQELRALITGEFAHMVSRGEIISIDSFVPTDDLMTGIQAMDLVCTPYPQHAGPASIAIRAAAAGRPVLGSNIKWINHIIPIVKLGEVFEIRDEQAFVRAIERSFETVGAWTPAEITRRFAEFHSTVNYQRTWMKRLRSRLGLPGEDIRTWSWVLTGTNGE